GLPVAGMILTGEDGATVEARYPDGLVARAIKRSDLDWALVHDAVAAGVDFIDNTLVLDPIIENGGAETSIGGVWIRSNGRRRAMRATTTIGADGRRSCLAFDLGLARHPARPRRWAVGVYAERV